MNKIYKVVWSKVKNCYVVVSELAKNVISGSVKSAKVGSVPVAKGFVMGAVMAFMVTGSAFAAGGYITEGPDNVIGAILVAENGQKVVVGEGEGNVNVAGTVSATAASEVIMNFANVTVESGEHGLVATNGGEIDIDATNNINITRTGENHSGVYAEDAIVTLDAKLVNIIGGYAGIENFSENDYSKVIINATDVGIRSESGAIDTSNGEVTINATGTTYIDGSHINEDGSLNNYGIGIFADGNSSVNIGFKGEDSALKGAVFTEAEAKTNLSFTDGATWYMDGARKHEDGFVSGNENVVSKLEVNDANIVIHGAGEDSLSIGILSGKSVNFALSGIHEDVGKFENAVNIEQAQDDVIISVTTGTQVKGLKGAEKAQGLVKVAGENAVDVLETKNNYIVGDVTYDFKNEKVTSTTTLDTQLNVTGNVTGGTYNGVDVKATADNVEANSAIIERLEDNIEVNEEQIAYEAQTRQEADNKLQANIYEEATAREDADNQLQGNIDAEANRLQDNIAEVREYVGELANEKADKADTLAGYGIADAYTQEEVNKKIAEATKGFVSDANLSELQNKTQNITAEEGKTEIAGDVTVSGDITAKTFNGVSLDSFSTDDDLNAMASKVTNGYKAADRELQGRLTSAYQAADAELEAKVTEAYQVADNELKDKIVANENDIANNANDIATNTSDIKVNANAIANNKAEIERNANNIKANADAIELKADKADTLAGYGITDAYTQAEVDNKIAEATKALPTDANFSEVQNKTQNITAEAGKTAINGDLVINGEKEGQITIDTNGQMVFGQNSTAIDSKGVYVGRVDETDAHNFANAKAALNEDGEIKGAGGKFAVDKDGNVQAETYNGVDINQLEVQAGNNSDAINGLNQRLGKMNGKINKVGAGAAALAALHPLEYDPDDKLTFSAGMGNYNGENAAALGAFYRPDEKLMFSLGGTMGNGENMVNVGVSIGLDKPNGYTKMSKRELIQEVNAVKAENESMKAEMAEMKAMLKEVLAKK